VDNELIKRENEIAETYWWFVGRRTILESVLRRFGKRSRVAVDVGCGTGRNMQLLSNYSDCVFGFDFSRVAVGLAASQGLRVACADCKAMPLADASAELLSALDVLEHLDDDMRGLREFHRVLKSDGLLLLTVPAYRFLWSEHDEALWHRRRYVASELHVKLTCSGFRVLKRTYAVFFAFFPIVVYRLFRGLFPKDPLAPKASHVILPAPLNKFLTGLLKIEAWMMGAVNIPWGTSIIVLAQKVPDSETQTADDRPSPSGPPRLGG
jgi:SAM-dependent methyltransferase